MTPFLRQVASHYFVEGGMEFKCFIFPNRRSLTFFRKYLSESVKENGRPMIAPQMLTVNDFFFRLGGKKSTDRLHLLLMLYDCYHKLNPIAEPLDDFIFWGDVLLADFDDVDKYLVDASHLFTNVADFKGMQDDFSYLTDTQKDAVDRFLKHFSAEGRIKTEFRKIWNILLPLYISFRDALSAEGLSYEGQVYRSIAERLVEKSAPDVLEQAFPHVSKYVFIGLNALNECEKKLMRKTRDAGMAEFCWDYSGTMISDPRNKSSLFLSEFTVEFPQAFKLEDEETIPVIRAISVPSGIGQAKQIPSILEGLSQGKVPGIETAIILPDETMLVPVLNSIPANVKDLNVTMGYPMTESSLFSLMNDIATMQMHIRDKDGIHFFYHKQVWSIFSNSIFKNLLDDAGKEIVAAVRKDARYFIPEADLSGHPVFDLIFRVAGDNIRAIEDYQQELCAGIAKMLSENTEMALELDFAKEFWEAVARLRTYDLPVRKATYFRLLSQIASGISVPFRGEPLKGLQIMGPLETRALDFDNIIILNCNEGMFPRHNVSSSFIPPELRKAFGLPTYEFQDAVWAYYFYRMIRRAGNVTLLYDSRTEVSRSGEESRYIKQLEMHFGIKVEHLCATSPLAPRHGDDSIPKKEEDIERFRREGNLSASALQNYLSCPAMFYYNSICGLKEEDEISESLDAGMVGTIFHEVMQELYKNRGSISKTYLDDLVNDSDRIRSCVKTHILGKLKCLEVTGRNIIYEDLVCRFVGKVLQRDRELLDTYNVPSFIIFGLEKECRMRIGGFNFKGYIDRLDCFAPGELRIVDYKTGKVTDEDFIIDAENAVKVVNALFGEADDKRPKIALQLYLYDVFAHQLECAKGRQIINSIYSTSRLFVNGVEEVTVCPEFSNLMKDRLSSLLEEIADTSKPWVRKRDEKNKCCYCKFKRICGQ